MSYSYLPTAASAYQPARRDTSSPSGALKSVQDALSAAGRTASSQLSQVNSVAAVKALTLKTAKVIFTIPNAFVLLWICTLWWGERTVFRDSVESCVWSDWEKWVSFVWLHSLYRGYN